MTRRIRGVLLTIGLAAGILLTTGMIVAVLVKALVLVGGLHGAVFGSQGIGIGLAALVTCLTVLSAVAVITLAGDAYVRGRWEALRVSSPVFRRRRP